MAHGELQVGPGSVEGRDLDDALRQREVRLQQASSVIDDDVGEYPIRLAGRVKSGAVIGYPGLLGGDTHPVGVAEDVIRADLLLGRLRACHLDRGRILERRVEVRVEDHPEVRGRIVVQVDRLRRQLFEAGAGLRLAVGAEMGDAERRRERGVVDGGRHVLPYRTLLVEPEERQLLARGHGLVELGGVDRQPDLDRLGELMEVAQADVVGTEHREGGRRRGQLVERADRECSGSVE